MHKTNNQQKSYFKDSLSLLQLTGVITEQLTIIMLCYSFPQFLFHFDVGDVR